MSDKTTKVRKVRKVRKVVTKPVDTSNIPSPAPIRYSILNEELDSLPIREAYPKLKAKLQMDLKRVGDNQIRELIFQVSEDRRMAGYIYAVSRDDLRRLEDAFEVEFGGWITQARKAIAKLKKNKEWEGGVNKEDVHAWIARNVPEWRIWREKIREATRIKKAAAVFYEAYRDRGSLLQTFAKLVEKRRGIDVTSQARQKES